MHRSLSSLLGQFRKSQGRRNKTSNQRLARKALFEPLESRHLMATLSIGLVSNAREVWNLQPSNVPEVEGRFRVFRDTSGAAATYSVNFTVTKGADFTSADGALFRTDGTSLSSLLTNSNPVAVSLTFPAGSNYTDIVFNPEDDALWEHDETLKLRIDNGTGYTANSEATMVLEDWDRPYVVNMRSETQSPAFNSFWPGLDAIAAGDPSMGAIKQVITVSEGQQGTINFDRMGASLSQETHVLFKAVSTNATLTGATPDLSLSGTNLVSFDPTSGFGVVTFPANATTTSFTYSANASSAGEAKESVTFTLEPSGGSSFQKYNRTFHMPNRSTVVDIVDSGSTLPTFSVQKVADAAEIWNYNGAAAAPGKLRIHRSGAADAATYNLSITATGSTGLTQNDGTAWPVLLHSAVAATHFITVDFPVNATFVDIVYNPADDAEWEFDEFLTVTLNAWSGYNLDPNAANRTATMKVVDRDRPVVVNMQGVTQTTPQYNTYWPGKDAVAAGDPGMLDFKQSATLTEGEVTRIHFNRMGTSATEETRFRFKVSTVSGALNGDYSFSGANLVSFNPATGIGVGKFPVGVTAVYIEFNALADGVAEAAREKFIVELQEGEIGSQYQKYGITGHIPHRSILFEIRDPGAPLPTFGIQTITDAIEPSGVAGAPGRLRIYRSGETIAAQYNLNITATPSSSLAPADGTSWPVLVHSAVAANHYITVTFPSGATYVDLVYNPADDSGWEFDESITVTLNDWPDVYARDSQMLSAVLGVIDSDRPPVRVYAVPDGGPSTSTPITVALANNDPNAGNMAQVGQVAEGSGATIYFQNEQVKNVDTTVRFQLSGSGTYGADFTLSSAFLVSFDAQTKIGVMRIPANSTTVGLEFDSLSEGVNESPERALFTLLSPDASASTPYTVTGFAPFANVAVDIIDKPNLSIDWFSGNGTDWTVEYTVEQNPSLQPITIRFYTTEDGVTPDTLLGSTTRTSSNELAVGAHAITVAPNFVDPNASAIYEHLGHRLLAVINQPALIAETNESDNKRIFDGGIFRVAQQPAEFVYVHGTAAADDVLISKAGSDTRVRVSHPILYGSSAGDVSGDLKRSQIDVDILEYNLVVSASSLWKNTTNNLDVNGDGFVTPLDSLIIANELNLNGAHLLASPGPGTATNFMDVNGDHFVSHADANAVIDYLEGSTPNPGSNRALDVNSDGSINNADLTALYSAWDATVYSVLLSSATQRQVHVRTHAGKDNIVAAADVQSPIVAWGGAGNDRLVGSSAIDTLFGQAGDDYLDGNMGDDVIEGGADDDVIYGRDGNDIANGWLGNDTIYGGDGSDQIVGSAGNDQLYGEEGSDTIYGQDGDDWLYGGPADDILYAGNGNDFAYGDSGNDSVFGGLGADTLRGGSGRDNVRPRDTGNQSDDGDVMINDPPEAYPDQGFSTSEDQSLSIPINGFLVNDVDDVGQDPRAVPGVIVSAKGAVVTIAADGNFTYDPTTAPSLQSLAAGDSVVDTFTYTLRDPSLATSTATVSINVLGVDDATRVLDGLYVVQSQLVAGQSLGVVGVVDDENTAHAFAIVGGNDSGAVAISETGELIVVDPSFFSFSSNTYYTFEIAVNGGSQYGRFAVAMPAAFSLVGPGVAIQGQQYTLQLASDVPFVNWTVNWGDQLDSGGESRSQFLLGNANSPVQASQSYVRSGAINTQVTVHAGDTSYAMPDWTVNVSQDLGVNIAYNGSFEQVAVSHPDKWDVFQRIPGWALTAGPRIELHANGVVYQKDGTTPTYIGQAAHLQQWAELDADENGHTGSSPYGENGQSTIEQVLYTIPGATYTVRFAIAGRPGPGGTVDSMDNRLRVEVAGGEQLLLSELVEATSAAWQLHEMSFVAVGNQSVIRFADEGIYNNTSGTLLDNVFVALANRPPRFEKEEYSFILREDVKSPPPHERDAEGQPVTVLGIPKFVDRWTVGKVVATDPESSPVSYMIKEGNEENLFVISGDGTLKANKSKLESVFAPYVPQKRNYELTIEAKDSDGATSTTQVKVALRQVVYVTGDYYGAESGDTVTLTFTRVSLNNIAPLVVRFFASNDGLPYYLDAADFDGPDQLFGENVVRTVTIPAGQNSYDLVLTPKMNADQWADQNGVMREQPEDIGVWLVQDGDDEVAPTYELVSQYGEPQNGEELALASAVISVVNDFKVFIQGAGDTHEVALNDVNQGVISNCWLAAAIGAMAYRDPAGLKGMFQIDEPNEKVVITFHEGTGSAEIEVDLGVYGNAATARFGDSDAAGNFEIWAKLLEKAFTQFKPTDGSPADVWRAFTGGPTESIEVEQANNDVTVETVKTALAAGKKVVFSSGIGYEKIDGVQLIPLHVFVVTGVTGQGASTAFTLYNPWGAGSPAPEVPANQLYTFIKDVDIQ